MKYVLDACAVIAFIRDEEGSVLVRRILESEENSCFIHAVNLCEIYYDCVRSYGSAKAEILVADLATAGLVVRDDMDMDFWKAAGTLKARGRISLADCFAVALALRENAALLTSDRHEFEPLVAMPGFPVTVEFIR